MRSARVRAWSARRVAPVVAVLVVASVIVALRRRAASTRWPSPSARLELAQVEGDFPRRKIALDPGHGANGNKGNTSSRCEAEQDFTLALAREVATRLEATGRFTVQLTRDGDGPVEYAARVDRAKQWGADVFVSLHSDVRGPVSTWTAPGSSRACPYAPGRFGTSVLFSDEGALELASERRALADATARSLATAGFPAYGGDVYGGLYEAIGAPGVFVDRHAQEQRIFVLRRTTMPAILVETHNATDPIEAERWTETRTREAFAAALARGLATFFAARGASPSG